MTDGVLRLVRAARVHTFVVCAMVQLATIVWLLAINARLLTQLRASTASLQQAEARLQADWVLLQKCGGR